MTTVLATAPTALTTAKALNPAGPILEPVGNAGLVLLKLKEASQKLLKLIAATDAGDTSLTQLNAVQAGLLTSNSPATLIASMTTAITAGPTAATNAKAINPAGPIVGYVGMMHSVRLNLAEAKVLIATVIAATDASDPNLTAYNNVAGALV
jgi:hypothetical protein